MEQTDRGKGERSGRIQIKEGKEVSQRTYMYICSLVKEHICIAHEQRQLCSEGHQERGGGWVELRREGENREHL